MRDQVAKPLNGLHKLFAVLSNNLIRFFTKPFNIVMMFAAPLLITFLLYAAFGDLGGKGDSPGISGVRVDIVNLDQGQHSFQAGKLLFDLFANDTLASMFTVTEGESPQETSKAIRKGNRALGIIIPPDFTAEVFSEKGKTTITILKDPTLTVAPQILEDILTEFVEGLSESNVTTLVLEQQLIAYGVTPDNDTLREASLQYARWIERRAEVYHERGGFLRVVSVGEGQKTTDSIIMTIMASMIIFFVFFMGANGAEVLIREREEGTLERIKTTPVSGAVVLGGVFLAILVTLVIQTFILLFASQLLFGLSWGPFLPLLLSVIGLVTAAGGFGIFAMSFVNNSRQSGPVLGGVMTITGMLSGLFTTGVPDADKTFGPIARFLPQGITLRGWQLMMAEAPLDKVAIQSGVTVLAGTGFLVLGLIILRRKLL